MTSKHKSCGVAFPIERNCATSDTQDATSPATYPQPISLKSLASKVLQRNKERNLSATGQGIDRNFSPENGPQKLRVAAPATLDENSMRTVATVSVADEKKGNDTQLTDRQPVNTDSTPAPCRDCNRIELINIMGAMVAGCLYPAAGEFPEGWKRLPETLNRCMWNHPEPRQEQRP